MAEPAREPPRLGIAGARPGDRAFFKVRSLRPHNTEALTRRRFHDPPTFDVGDPLCAKRLKPQHLGFDMVRLDVNMNAARVIYSLHQHLHLIGRTFETAVVRVVWIDRSLGGAAERGRPEAGGLVEILGLTVDDDGA